MPTCRDMSELATDYLEHAAPRRVRFGMWLHLLQCAACRRYFDQMRRTIRLIGGGPPAPANRQAEDAVLAAVRGQRDG